MLLGAGLLAWAVLRGDGEDAAAPEEPSTPAPTATTPAAPTEEATEEATEDAEPPGEEGDVSELAEQVSEVRGLPLREPVQARVVSEGALADKVAELAFEDLSPERAAADERLLVALRLVDPGLDLVAALEQLYREQILGVYVPEERVFYVRSGTGDLSPFERLTAAHEVTHALQDQSYDLSTLQDLPDERSDEQLARLALVEGDAVLTQEVWSARYQTQEERAQVREEALAGGGSDALAATPRYLRESLTFPYREGVAFAQALAEQGGFPALDAAHEEPPTTTAQIIHPERYLERVEAVDVTIDAAPGPGWEESSTYQFGEFDLRQLLQPLGSATVERVGTGWAGGHVRSWLSADETAVAVALAFDSAADADEACDAIQGWYGQVAEVTRAGDGVFESDTDALAYSCDSAGVSFAIAPDADLAAELAVR